MLELDCKEVTVEDVNVIMKEFNIKTMEDLMSLDKEGDIRIFRGVDEFLDWIYIANQDVLGLIDSIRNLLSTNVKDTKEEYLSEVVFKEQNAVEISEGRVVFSYS